MLSIEPNGTLRYGRLRAFILRVFIGAFWGTERMFFETRARSRNANRRDE